MPPARPPAPPVPPSGRDRAARRRRRMPVPLGRLAARARSRRRDDPRYLACLRLSPDGAEEACRRADHGDWLAAQRVVREGREAQSRAFFRTPGIDPLNSGIAIITPSALAIAARSCATAGSAGSTSRSASYGGSARRPSYSSSSMPRGSALPAARSRVVLCEPCRRLPEMPRIRRAVRPSQVRGGSAGSRPRPARRRQPAAVPATRGRSRGDRSSPRGRSRRRRRPSCSVQRRTCRRP